MKVLRTALLDLLVGSHASSEVIRFDAVTPEGLPTGWTVAMTHGGGAPRWEIMRDASAPKGMPSRAYGVKYDIPKGRWNNLRVVFKDAQFSVFFNGAQVFETEDRTFAKAGRAGLWTKADSVTYFDDFSVTGN